MGGRAGLCLPEHDGGSPMCTVELKPRAIKDMRNLQRQDSSRIVDALERLQLDLAGDVKKLTNFTPEYRLRVGQFRVLFEI
jgi:mRNA interferase RelE/StbE